MTIDALYAVHVKGPVLLTELLAPMIRNGGRVLFTSTGLARYVANPAYSVYAAVKGAIEIYARYAAKALGAGDHGQRSGARGDRDRFRRRQDPRRCRVPGHGDDQPCLWPRGRTGEEIGGAVRAIVSGSAGWITAQRIEASGGQSL